MSKENENNDPTFEGLNPPTLFREFAAECMELAQTIPTPEKRSLYMKMASLWPSNGTALGARGVA